MRLRQCFLLLVDQHGLAVAAQDHGPVHLDVHSVKGMAMAFFLLLLVQDHFQPVVAGAMSLTGCSYSFSVRTPDVFIENLKQILPNRRLASTYYSSGHMN
jgi:hypothetical protein